MLARQGHRTAVDRSTRSAHSLRSSYPICWHERVLFLVHSQDSITLCGWRSILWELCYGILTRMYMGGVHTEGSPVSLSKRG